MKKLLVILIISLALVSCGKKVEEKTTENTTSTIVNKKEAQAPQKIIKSEENAQKLTHIEEEKQAKIKKEIDQLLAEKLPQVAITKKSLENVIASAFNDIQKTYKHIDFSDYKAEMLKNLEENFANIEKSSMK